MRFRFAEWAQERLVEDDNFYRKIVFTDEVHFHLGGYVNKQNCRIWGSENPHVVLEKPMHPQRVAVCCGMWSGGIFGPFFFENEEGATVTVNDVRYRGILEDFFFPRMEEVDIDDIWFQQDRATCHTATSQSIFCAVRRCQLAASQLRFDPVGLFFVGYRKGEV